MRFLNSIIENFLKSEADRTRFVTVILPSFIVQTLSALLSLGLSILLARGMGASDYGIFTYVFSIVFLIVNLSSYGLNILVVRETSAFIASGKLSLLKGFSKWALAVVLVTCLLLAIVVGILTYYFHLMPSEDYTKPMLVAAIAIPFYGLLSFYTSSLRGMNKIVISLLCEPFIKHATFFGAVLVAYLISRNMNLMNIVYLNTITFIIGCLAAFLFYRKSNELKNETTEYDLKSWWTKLGSLLLMNGLMSFESKIDVFMLGYMKDSSQVGIYAGASKVATSLTFFLVTMNFIIGPTISKLNVLNEKQRLQEMITKTIRWVVVFSLPAFILLVVLSKWIMTSLFSSSFADGQIALIILSCAQLVSILFGPAGQIVLMTGNEKYFTIYTICCMFILVVLNLLLIPSMGYNGAAISTACSIVFWNAAMFITIKKKLGVSAWIFG